LLERISEAQPFASSAMLELLSRSIDEAQATIAATEATVNEEKRSFGFKKLAVVLLLILNRLKRFLYNSKRYSSEWTEKLAF